MAFRMPELPRHHDIPSLPPHSHRTIIYDSTDIQVILLHKTPSAFLSLNRLAHPPPRSISSLVVDVNRICDLQRTARLVFGRHSPRPVQRPAYRTSRQPSDHHSCGNRTPSERQQKRQSTPRREGQSRKSPSTSAIDNSFPYTDLNAYNALFAQDHLYALDSLTALNSPLLPSSTRGTIEGTSSSVEANNTQSRGGETVALAGEWDFLMKRESSVKIESSA